MPLIVGSFGFHHVSLPNVSYIDHTVWGLGNPGFEQEPFKTLNQNLLFLFLSDRERFPRKYTMRKWRQIHFSAHQCFVFDLLRRMGPMVAYIQDLSSCEKLA